MIVVPAIDLRGGRVVRLHQGRAEQETVYGDNPAELARRFEGEGAKRIHLVDLDAAMNGPRQDAAVAEVVRAVRIPVEVGGGVRTLEDALRLREQGVERVIFGTAAVARPDVVQAAIERISEAVAVAIDARDGRVAVAAIRAIVDEPELSRVRRVGFLGRGAEHDPRVLMTVALRPTL